MNFLKKLSIKTKTILVVITFLATIVISFILTRRVNMKKYLEFALKEVKFNKEIIDLEEDSIKKNLELEALKQQEKEISDRIDSLEPEKENMSWTEIQDFFKNRGV